MRTTRMTTAPTARWLLAAGWVLIGAACDSSSSSPFVGWYGVLPAIPNTPEADAYLDCGIITRGPVQQYVFAIESDADQCYQDCIAELSCADIVAGIRDAVCTRNGHGHVDCGRSCYQAEWLCAEGTAITQVERCDAISDCPDGSDETGCTYFVCDDGELLPTSFKCDGSPNCASGEDEDEDVCPRYQCKDSFTLGPRYVCDMIPDCPYGDDEEGCAAYTFPCN